MADLPGLALERVAAWLTAHEVAVMEPLKARRITGGRSNLTFRVDDACGRSFIVRRPPLHGALPSAHDMGREARILRALRSTTVPVPGVLAECPQDDVIGAPFYVMDFVDGVVVRDIKDAEELLEPGVRAVVSHRLVATLVELHRLRPVEVGLGSLGRPDGYLERQLRRWLRQSEHVRGPNHSAIREIHAALESRQPEQQRVSIVHGDYRIDNAIISETGEIRAILDWELCTLGDPLVDLGMLVAYWNENPDEFGVLNDGPTSACGFPSRDEIIGLYADSGLLDLSPLPYYVAFALWKIAVIMAGVYERFSSGAYGVVDPEIMDFEERGASLLTQARRILNTGQIDLATARRP